MPTNIEMSLSNLRTKLKKFGEIYDKLDQTLCTVIGLPNYDKYVEHMKKTHPDEEPMGKAEFFRKAQDDRAKNVKC